MHYQKTIATAIALLALAAPCLAAEGTTATSQSAASGQTAQAGQSGQPELKWQAAEQAQQQGQQTPAQAQPAPAAQVAGEPPADIITWVTPETATAPIIVGTLAPNQVALGKIHIHDTPGWVTRVWQAPTSVSGQGKWLTYVYGETFGVRFHQSAIGEREYGVSEVSTIASNGIATPAGITVGMDESILQQKYGMPSRLSSASKENGYTTTYFYYGYMSELGHELSFDVQEGKIVKIRLRSYYEYPGHFY